MDTDNHTEKPHIIKRVTIVEEVMKRLRELILSDHYKPGDKIPTEKELAKRFGIGRSSIREAIKVFNYLGILNSKAAKGTFLTKRSDLAAKALAWTTLIGEQSWPYLLEVQGALEVWSLTTFTKEASEKSPEEFKKVIEFLEAEVRTMEEEAEKDGESETVRFREAEERFHCAVVDSLENPLFESIYRTLQGFVMKELGGIEKEKIMNPKQVSKEHREILEALRTKDCARILQAFFLHISNDKKQILRKAL